LTDDHIILNVHIEALEGRQEDLACELIALLAPTRQEQGCIAYELHRDFENDKKFMFYERFVNQAALDLHLKAPYFQKFVEYRKTDDPISTQTVSSWRSLA
jgi:quinol monooxygenase YgiN